MICLICGHEDPNELVRHVNERHNGLDAYLTAFPNGMVVSRDLFAAIEYENFFSTTPTDIPGLDAIPPQDRKRIAEHAFSNRLQRSEIVVTYDS